MSSTFPIEITVSRLIAAPADRLYDLISDLPSVPRHSPETVAVGTSAALRTRDSEVSRNR